MKTVRPGLKRKIRLAGALILVAGLAGGCANTGTPLDQFGQKSQLGAVLGATGGGLLAAAAGGGSTGIAAGVLLGGLTGGVVGNNLDNQDRRFMQQASQRALETAPTGKPTTWKNPDGGHSGSFTPTRTIERADGSYCREYQQTITIGGEQQQGVGSACRLPDGSWRTA